ncbi:MAG: hypothetical protein KDA46_12020, partial [Parvularculaceae bacterium]|nr:hypothetical protein [Parvularculaceae bacterium]
AIFGNGPVAMISGLVVAAAAGGAAFFAFDDRAPAQAGTAPAPAAMESAPSAIEPSAIEPAPADPAPAPVAADPAPAETDDARNIRLAQNNPAPAPATSSASLDFTLGSLDDLRREPVASLLEKIDSIPDVAERTKVWTARADVASAPGVETFYHVKGPVTCGRVGCDLVVLGDVGGARALLLDTVAEDVSSPQADTLVVNAGTPAEVTWVFDGAAFVEQR